MNATPTPSLLSALDQRLLVSRVSAVDAARAPATQDQDRPADVVRTTSPAPAAGKAVLDFAARWPVGSVVDARVTTSDDDRVEADLDGLAVGLQWSEAEGALPRAGQVIAFRVMAHEPGLLLQRAFPRPVPVDASPSSDVPTHLSAEARALQAATVDARSGSHEGGPLRFTAPLIALPDRPATALPAQVDPDAALVAASRSAPEAANALPFVPVVLQGPAWRDQPIELVIRRQPRDERLDDPGLDDWCGELVIDLPSLGRVAGHLSYSMQGLRLRVEADRDVGAAALTAAAAELAESLADAHVRLASFSIGRPLDTMAPGAEVRRA